MKKKYCPRCKITKSYKNFYKHKRTKDGYYCYCILCSQELNKSSYKKHRIKRIKGSKNYYNKNKEKALRQRKKYYKKTKHKFKEFKKKYAEKYRQINRKKLRKKQLYYILNKFYKLNIKDYNKLLKSQNYKCAICRKPETRKNKNGKFRLSIDHDHKTNKVRGLLCHWCNTRLGFFKDNINLLNKLFKSLINIGNRRQITDKGKEFLKCLNK